MKKLSMLFTGAMLSAVVLVGCNNADNPTNNRITPDVNDNINRNMNNLNDRYRNDLNDNLNINDRYNNNLNDRYNINEYDNDMDLNDNIEHYSPAEDKNTPTDKDPMKDRNTKKEDIIEDDIDVNDRDTKDE